MDCGLELVSLLNFEPYLIDPSHIKKNMQEADLKQKLDGSSSSILTKHGQNIYINDTSLKFQTPQFNLFDMSMVDVVLISNVHSLLALPFLTEHCPGFKAKVYATEPTKYLGRYVLQAK